MHSYNLLAFVLLGFCALGVLSVRPFYLHPYSNHVALQFELYFDEFIIENINSEAVIFMFGWHNRGIRSLRFIAGARVATGSGLQSELNVAQILARRALRRGPVQQCVIVFPSDEAFHGTTVRTWLADAVGIGCSLHAYTSNRTPYPWPAPTVATWEFRASFFGVSDFLLRWHANQVPYLGPIA